jgi:hypothetical protein
MGHAVAQLIQTLRFQPKRHGYGSQWCHYGRNMVLGLTQPVTEMSTRNISWEMGVKAAGE